VSKLVRGNARPRGTTERERCTHVGEVVVRAARQVLRANQNNFDPVLQFTDRAATLAMNGHPVDKIEILVLGGTWSSYPHAYQVARWRRRPLPAPFNKLFRAFALRIMYVLKTT
jgi:hypothetical protein